MDRDKLTFNQRVILDDPHVEGFVKRAKDQGRLDGVDGVEPRPFFEQNTRMSWVARVLYDDRIAEDAIREAYGQAYEIGRTEVLQSTEEFGQTQS